jgi:hypothetical protein
MSKLAVPAAPNCWRDQSVLPLHVKDLILSKLDNRILNKPKRDQNRESYVLIEVERPDDVRVHDEI